MKVFLLAILFLSCTTTPFDVFNKFHKNFESRDFNSLQNLLSDDIIIENSVSKERFEKYPYVDDMKNWATVFNTKWIVINKKVIGDTVYSTEVDSDIFKDYFYDGGKKVKLKYVEKNNKLVYLSWDDGEPLKDKIYEERFIRFAQWCYKHYPLKFDNLKYQTQKALEETKIMLEVYLKESSPTI